MYVVWENYKLLTPQTLNLTGGLAGRERQKEGMGNKEEGWDRDRDREFDRGLKG